MMEDNARHVLYRCTCQGCYFILQYEATYCFQHMTSIAYKPSRNCERKMGRKHKLSWKGMRLLQKYVSDNEFEPLYTIAVHLKIVQGSICASLLYDGLCVSLELTGTYLFKNHTYIPRILQHLYCGLVHSIGGHLHNRWILYLLINLLYCFSGSKSISCTEEKRKAFLF